MGIRFAKRTQTHIIRQVGMKHGRAKREGCDFYADADGPKRGLSERGWKDRRPSDGIVHFFLLLSLCAGQLLTYMVTTNRRKLMVTTMGTNKEWPPPPRAPSSSPTHNILCFLLLIIHQKNFHASSSIRFDDRSLSAL